MIKTITKATLPVMAAFALLFAGSSSFGQTSTSTSKSPTRNSTMASTTALTDSQFAKQAAEGNYAEIKLGQLAAQDGTSKTVQNFGQRMVADHTEAENQLKTAAAKDKITLPTAVSAQDQATYKTLSKLSGQQFDKAYAQDMVKDHKVDIAKFQHEANDGKDTSIKSFASKTLPTLQTHMRMAQQMSQKVSASNTTNGTTTPIG
ncbi:MAG TPA: DUF4142 domain-containing protein [Candidatus Acidoferrales bacterium]